ncbi:MAG TPA: stage II sporulation protein M [Saprospiraceae bacterium]|nr:stage II sporulation protein M [Saprospiraceae bacterium]
MKETNFIKQNREKWERLEKAIDNPNEKADELSDLFIQVTDDLSYSRTFYPNRSIRAYLNWLAQRLFFKIYRAKKLKKKSFFNFWTDELPQIMYESRKEVLLAFVVFVLSFLIGALSQSMDPHFANIILGDAYVDETIKNIESGDPLAIYKSSGPFGMAVGIISNNLYVALLCFLLGVFASVGSIGMLVSNGVMVGVFQYFFYERGLLGESFLTIWTHGAFEISAIILAGAAGIVLGKGLLFPGTYHRLKAFQVTAQRGLKIYLGIVPFIIIAGIIEGYITRMTNTPDIIRLSFILISFGIMVGYFVIYPIIKHRRGARSKIPVPYLQPDNDAPIEFNKTKTTGEIFKEILSLYRKYAQSIIAYSVGMSLFFVLTIIMTSDKEMTEVFSFTKYFGNAMSSLYRLLDFKEIFPYLNALLLSATAWFAYRIVSKEKKETTPLSPLSGLWVGLLSLIPALGFMFILSFLRTLGISVLLFPIILPIVLSMIVGLYQSGVGSGFLRGPQYVFKQLGVEMALNMIIIFLGFSIISLASSTILYYLVYFFGMNFQADNEWMALIIPVLFTFMTEFLILWVFFGFLFGAHLTWFSAKEIMEANNLQEAIQKIGTEKRIKGMLRE